MQPVLSGVSKAFYNVEKIINGAITQLVEYLFCKQKVSGSNPDGSTYKFS